MKLNSCSSLSTLEDTNPANRTHPQRNFIAHPVLFTI
jgi:hypothetical protein